MDLLPEDPKRKKTLAELLLAKLEVDKGAHAVFFEVSDAVGTTQRRRIDAVSIGMWASTKRLIQGYEFKSSRADWLRELKDLEKADPFIERCDRFWLVTDSEDLAKLEEIPATWGWMARSKNGKGLRMLKPAQQLGDDRGPINRLFLFAVLRHQAGDIMRHPQVVAALRSAEDSSRQRVESIRESVERHERDKYNAIQEIVATFERESGIKLSEWRYGRIEALAKLVRGFASTSPAHYVRQLEHQANCLRTALQLVDEATANLQQAIVADVGDPDV